MTDQQSEDVIAELDLREALAALAHEQWSGWMRYLFSRGCSYPGTDGDDGGNPSHRQQCLTSRSGGGTGIQAGGRGPSGRASGMISRPLLALSRRLA